MNVETKIKIYKFEYATLKGPLLQDWVLRLVLCLRVYALPALLRPLWQYGLWSFQTGGTKLERFLPKNQHTQRKLMNF